MGDIIMYSITYEEMENLTGGDVACVVGSIAGAVVGGVLFSFWGAVIVGTAAHILFCAEDAG
jgi:hypothetical protein